MHVWYLLLPKPIQAEADVKVAFGHPSRDEVTMACQAWHTCALNADLTEEVVRRLQLRSQWIGSREWESSWTLDNDCTQ